MVCALYKEVEDLAHGGSRVGSDLPAKGFPARPAVLVVLLPDSAVTAAHEDIDIISGGHRYVPRRSG